MKTKTEIKFFNVVQYEQEAEYLRNMHKSGWKFVKLTGLGKYHFEACQPEDVVYQLDYNQEGRRNREEYIQMFADCGWEYLQDAFGYSYFRKPAAEIKGEESIFCDDESRMEMMNRVFRGRLLPLIVIFFCCLLPQFFNSMSIYHSPFITGLLGAVIGLYLVMFLSFTYYYINYRKENRK